MSLIMRDTVEHNGHHRVAAVRSWRAFQFCWSWLHCFVCMLSVLALVCLRFVKSESTTSFTTFSFEQRTVQLQKAASYNFSLI